MSFSDEQAELSSPGPDAHRVLSPGDLEDLNVASDRILGAIPEAILAFRNGDGELMMDALGAMMSGVTTTRCNLGLDELEDDDELDLDELPTAGPPERSRITRNGGRTDG